MGIGINLFPESIPENSAFIFPATYLQKHCKKKIQAEKFLKAVLEKIIHLRASIASSNFIEEYQKRLAYLYESVFLISPDGTSKSGVCVGVNQQGALRLHGVNGKIMEFPAGDLSLRKENQAANSPPD